MRAIINRFNTVTTRGYRLIVQIKSNSREELCILIENPLIINNLIIKHDRIFHSYAVR